MLKQLWRLTLDYMRSVWPFYLGWAILCLAVGVLYGLTWGK